MEENKWGFNPKLILLFLISLFPGNCNKVYCKRKLTKSNGLNKNFCFNSL